MRISSISLYFPVENFSKVIYSYILKKIVVYLASLNFQLRFVFVACHSEMTLKAHWEKSSYPQMYMKKSFSDILSVYYISVYLIFILLQ